MKKVFAVIRREMVERIRTKAFLISTFLLPILMVVMMVVPALMMGGGERTQRVAIVDGTPDGQLGAAVQTGLSTATFTKDGESRPLYDVALIAAPNGVQLAEDSLVALTGFSRDKLPTTLDGVLVLTSKTLESGEATYLGANAGSIQGVGALQGTLSQALMRNRLSASGVDEALVMRAMMRADIKSQKVSDGKLTGESGEASFVLAYGMGFLLYFVILIYGAQTATSVIEEKTSRIMEVLASSLTPFQMLLGKIVGVGLTGLLQVGIWGGRCSSSVANAPRSPDWWGSIRRRWPRCRSPACRSTCSWSFCSTSRSASSSTVLCTPRLDRWSTRCRRCSSS